MNTSQSFEAKAMRASGREVKRSKDTLSTWARTGGTEATAFAAMYLPWSPGVSGPEQGERPVRTGDGVSPILITGNDMAGAWAIGADGNYILPTVPNSPLQRIYALRAGVNIMMYMLTGNYKADQVHIPALLERLGQ